MATTMMVMPCWKMPTSAVKTLLKAGDEVPVKRQLALLVPGASREVARGEHGEDSTATAIPTLPMLDVRRSWSSQGRPPRCRAARSRPPGSWAAGVYSCKFPNRKFIFVKNKNKK